MATAADILGNGKKTIPPRWRRHYQRLCEYRDQIVGRENATPETAIRSSIDNLADAGTEETERGLQLAFNSNAHGLLIEITQAIRRIETRAYGLCEITGQPIEANRLEAIPWARCSLRGQIEMEKTTPRKPAIPAVQSIADAETPSEEDDEEEAEKKPGE